MRYLVLVTAIVFGACSSQTYWRNNNPQANWGSDLYNCTRENSTTITAGGGTGIVGQLNALDIGSVKTDYAMRDLCLKSRGWYQVAEPESPPTASPPRFVPVSQSQANLQRAWLFIGTKGQSTSWLGYWGSGGDASDRCNDVRHKFQASPNNAQWNVGQCRMIDISFQEGQGARFPGWGVSGDKGFVGAFSEQDCTSQRTKLMAANPSTTYKLCQPFWFSAEPK